MRYQFSSTNWLFLTSSSSYQLQDMYVTFGHSVGKIRSWQIKVFLKIRFQYILAQGDKMYWKIILKNTGFVIFHPNLIYYSSISGPCFKTFSMMFSPVDVRARDWGTSQQTAHWQICKHTDKREKLIFYRGQWPTLWSRQEKNSILLK